MRKHDDILDRLWAARPKVYTAICKDSLEEFPLRIEYVQVTPQADRAVEHQMAMDEARRLCASAWERVVEYAPCMSEPDPSTIVCIGLFEGGVEAAMLDEAYFDCSA